MQQQTVQTLYKPLNILVLLILLTCFFDRAIQEGMFLDGITYAAISRNLAIGKGTLWNVYHRGELRFSEHPPLMFGMESIFFRIFGDQYITERIYCFFIFVMTLLGFWQLWKSISTDRNFRQSFALPLFVWGFIPTVIWAYPNNLLDTTMAMFDLFAVYAIYNALQTNKAIYLKMLTAGVLVFLATLIKGPVGLFPLAIPVVYWLVFRSTSFGKTFWYSILLTLTLVICYVLLCMYQPARECLAVYLDKQLFSALEGKREVVTSPLGRFFILGELAMQLAVPAALVLILYIASKLAKKQGIFINDHRRQVLFFALTGLCASIPIMISIKQMPFYILPSFPYYAIALSLIGYPYFAALTGKVQLKPIPNRIINGVLVIAIITCTIYIAGKYGKTGRDEEMITDIKTMRRYIPVNEKIGTCNGMEREYSFLAYMERYNRMETNDKYHKARYVLVDKEHCLCNLGHCLSLMGFEPVPTDLMKYNLYKRVRPSQVDSIIARHNLAVSYIESKWMSGRSLRLNKN